MSLLAVLVVLASGAVMLQAVLDLRDRELLTRPGTTVLVDGVQMHVNVTGPADASGPVVVLDAAALSTSAQWGWVQDVLSRDRRVVSFDRPGQGGSSDPAQPLTAHGYADLLARVLARVVGPGPYVLVGHSMGALTVRAFASVHPDKVAGLVLVDPRAYDLASVYPGQDLDPHKDAQLALAPWLARLGLIRLARPLQDRIDELPPVYRAKAAAALASTHHNAGVLGDVLLGEDAATKLRALEDLGAIPIIVLTAEQADAVAFPEPLRARFTAQQEPLLLLSTRTSQRTIAGADHYTIVTRPEYAGQVIEAIRGL